MVYFIKRSLASVRQMGGAYVRGNKKLIWQAVFAVFFIAVGIWFVRHEQTELHQVRRILVTSSWQWLVTGVVLTVVYMLLQALMYVASFAAVGNRISVGDALTLFLKRNFISVFLPAGGISSLVFFTGNIEAKGISKTQIHLASSIYAFVGILSAVLVAIPAFLFALVNGGVGAGEWLALAGVAGIIVLGYSGYRSVVSKGYIYQKVIRYRPSAGVYLDDLSSNRIGQSYFALTVLYSVFIELTGIAHLYIAMIALHLEPSLTAAIFSYIVAIIFLIISPFLRGIGAIEVSMTFILMRFGFNDAAAISITFFYRFLEFWLPLFAGAMSFLFKINKLLMRVFPALLLLLLGVINIVSVVTPAIGERLHFLKEFLPTGVITVSNVFVLITGLFLLITAAFMLKGLRVAWYFALVLCLLSIVGHLTKAIDYEESSFALFVAVILFVSRKEYYIRNGRKRGLRKSMDRKEDLEWAKVQISKYGSSGIDYFKAYPDKMIFRAPNADGFVAFRVSGDFAVALGSPVTDKISLRTCAESFDKYCFRNGLRSIYFRIPEDHLHAFPGKKKLFLGQEGIMDLTTFSLDGGSRKSIRNALKKVTEKGYHSKIYTAPVSDEVLGKLKAVSDEWLADTKRSEIVFSQGMFLWDELREQTIITVESPDDQIVAFLNIIPDYASGEGTYDLIRKTKDAPNGTIDFITVEMFHYLKKEGYSAVNLGFAPLSGIADPRNFPEHSMKFAYEKIRAFSHYQGLRAFKEKFSPVWYNRYLVYDEDYDLFKVPGALSNVIKP
jgi:lysylphosphatidylglycerol synthetase-like protein (DUF2156 family)/uncharacterized membrane protein YbhN (UPF0104 family)